MFSFGHKPLDGIGRLELCEFQHSIFPKRCWV